MTVYKIGLVTDVHYRVGVHDDHLTRLSGIATLHQNAGSSALFMLGDIIDASTNRADSQTQIANIAGALSGKTTYWIPGSHDWQGTSQANFITDAAAFFNSPTSDIDYYVDFGNWRIICINTLVTNPPVASATTLTYLETQLETARLAGKYIIILTHGDCSKRYPGATSLADSIWLSPLSVVNDASTTLTGSITPSATTGSITLTDSASLFVAGDIGRWLLGMGTGNSWGVCAITAITDSAHAVATVQTDHDFPDTDAIASGNWGYLSTPITHNKDGLSGIVYNSEAIYTKINTAVSAGALVKAIFHGHLHTDYSVTNTGIVYYSLCAPSATYVNTSALLTLEEDGELRVTGVGVDQPRDTFNSNTVYVDQTSGSDTANGGGIITDPWKTIAKVNAATLTAGTNIYLKRGEMWLEQLTIPIAGSSGLPITVTSYGNGSPPILDGADAVATWTAATLGATVTSTPAADNDDGRHYGTTFELTNDFVGMGLYTTSRGGGIRFKSVAVPKDASITTAKVQFYAQATQSGVTCNAIVDGELNSHPAVFSTYADYIGRTHTTAHAHWDAIASWSNDAHGAAQLTPELKDIIAEITALSDWVSGHDLVLFFEDNGSSASAYRNASSVTWNSGNEKAVLSVTYGGVSSTIFQAACTWTPTQVFQDGVRLTYVAWDTDITTTGAAMSAGTWTLDDTGNLLYVWATDGADPDTHTMKVSNRSYCVTTNANDYVVIKNLNLKYANISNAYLDGANQSELNYCISEKGVAGATLAHASAKIQNSVIYGNVTGVDVNAAGAITNTIMKTNTTGLDEVGATAVVTYSALQDAHAGDGNITSDPLLMSTTDFHLQQNSPCINAGVDVGLTSDCADRPVPQSAGKAANRPSIGAYEFEVRRRRIQ